MNRYCFVVVSRWPQRKRNEIKIWPRKSGYKFEVLGQWLAKIYENLRKISWFIDWAWTSVFGFTLPKWAEIRSKRSNISNAHAQDCLKLLLWLMQHCVHPEICNSTRCLSTTFCAVQGAEGCGQSYFNAVSEFSPFVLYFSVVPSREGKILHVPKR